MHRFFLGDKRFQTEYPFEPCDSEQAAEIIGQADEFWQPVNLYGIVGNIQLPNGITMYYGGYFRSIFDLKEQSTLGAGHLACGGGAYQFTISIPYNQQKEVLINLTRIWATEDDLQLPGIIAFSQQTKTQWSIKETEYKTSGYARIYKSLENAFWLRTINFENPPNQKVQPFFQKLPLWNPTHHRMPEGPSTLKGIVGWFELGKEYSCITGLPRSAMAVGGFLLCGDNHFAGMLFDLFGAATIENLNWNDAPHDPQSIKIVKQYAASYPQMIKGSIWHSVYLNLSEELQGNIQIWGGTWIHGEEHRFESEKGTLKLYLF